MNLLFSIHASCYTSRIRSGLSFGYCLLENCKILRIVSNMDGLSGAASVIAVVSLASGSTQAIYNAISAVHNAPKSLQQLGTGLRTPLKPRKELEGNNDSYYLAADLPKRAQRCAADLKEFEEKLIKLSSSPSNKSTRLWRDFRAALQEKALDRMSTLIQLHITELSIAMQIKEG